MVRLRLASLLISSLLLVPPVIAVEPIQTIAPGEPAPPLVVSRWIRGGPVDRFEPGRVYVVDLWASWCQPCLETMPLLSRVQVEHAVDVTVIAMNVWEISPKKAAAFLASQGESLTVAVAMDSVPPGREMNEGLTAVAWLGTSEHVSIPRTFLIDRNGRVAWVGSPRELEGPLAGVIAGTWDVRPFAEQFAAKEKLESRYYELLKPVEEAVAASDWDKAFRASEAVVAADSTFAPRVASQGFAFIAMAVLGAKEVTPADLAIAQRSAERSIALQVDPDWGIFQLAARAARANGDIDAARTQLKAAMERAEGEDLAKLQAELEELNSMK